MLGGSFQSLVSIARGLEDPFVIGGSFQKLVSVVKGPDGLGAFRVLFWGSILVAKALGVRTCSGLVCLVRKASGGGGCVLGHGTLVVLPTIVWWGTVRSTLGAGSVSISVTKFRILLAGTPI